MDKHRPRKRFGQNFLSDKRVIQRIAEAINPQSSDHILEIGPGQAALTKALLPHCGRLSAIEIDRDLAASLRQEFAQATNFELIEHDALKFDFARVSPQPIRLVGNLPYNISTPLIFHLLQSDAEVTDFHIMLQKEVADRMRAQPGSKTYGRLSVAVQLAAEVEVLFDVHPGAFFPPPKVMSAIIRLRPRNNALPWSQLDRVLKAAFSARRKTLSNALKNLFSADELLALGVDSKIRPDALDAQTYLRLAQALVR